VRDGIADGRTLLLVDPVLIARKDEERMTLHRCACGRAWAEALWSVGHADVYYVFPVPDDVDALEWLVRAEQLPFHFDGPQGRP
jgi:hypothetical protein